MSTSAPPVTGPVPAAVGGKWTIVKVGTVNVTEVGLRVTVDIPNWEMVDPSGANNLTTTTGSQIAFTRDPYFGTTTKHLDHILIGGYSINEMIRMSKSANMVVPVTINTPAPIPNPQLPVVPDPPTLGRLHKPRPKFGWVG